MSKAVHKKEFRSGLPQFLYLGFALFYLGYSLAKDGAKETYTITTAVFFAVFAIILLSIGLYGWGGFFEKFSWPQIIRIVFWIFAFFQIVSKFGQPIETEISFESSFFSIAFESLILYAGGFFTH